MSINVTTAFVEQYSANVQHLVQQDGSKLRGLVREEAVVGKNAFFEQIGATAARRRPSRHSDTPRIDTPHSRRRVSLEDFDWADLIDDEDKVRMLIDPTSQYAQAAAKAMGRAMDEVLIDSALGTAYTGVSGSTSTAAQTALGDQTSNMNLDSLLAIKDNFDSNDVPDEGRVIVCTSSQIKSLLNTTEIQSADFNTVRALARGEVDSFMGFKFISINGTRIDGTKLIPVASSNRRCFAFQGDGLLLGVGKDMNTKISERADKNYATQVFCSMSIGGTRMEEARVLEVPCSE
tara:strand:- start:1756 stop:2628 length:873 start_codon:yes stop_codon:yes gene_type:complete